MRPGNAALAESIKELLLQELSVLGDTDDTAVRLVIDRLLFSDPRTRDLPIRTKKDLADSLFRSVRRMDILQELLDDPDVTEIMVNGPDHIFVERGGRICPWDKAFADREHLEDVVRKIAGLVNRTVNERSPIVDARLADGSRVNAVISPAALDGPILTIRRFPEHPVTMDTLIRNSTLTEDAAYMLSVLVSAGYSILIGGGTSSGKTTFLNALSAFIPPEERIITIEDTAELQIQGVPNLVRLEAKTAPTEGAVKITIRDLIKSALRMRPDRIIVGEVRGAEAVDLLQALNTGHDGSMSTLHANTAEDLLARLETMVLMAFPLPLAAIRSQIASGVDLIVHLGRMPDHTRRVLTISETCGIGGGRVRLRPLYAWDPALSRLVKKEALADSRKLKMHGLSL